MAMQNRSQRYATQALRCIESVRGQDKLASEYKTRAEGFPAMLMQAGLAQGLGFLLAKKGAEGHNAYGRYLDDLAAVLKAGGASTPNDGEALQRLAIQAPLAQYRLLTRETLAAAGWLKRFAQAYIANKNPGATP